MITCYPSVTKNVHHSSVMPYRNLGFLKKRSLLLLLLLRSTCCIGHYQLAQLTRWPIRRQDPQNLMSIEFCLLKLNNTSEVL